MRTIAWVYDNPDLRDRYTIIFNTGEAMALSERPGKDQGFARWILVDDYDGDKLGHSVDFSSLPRSVQEYALQESNRKPHSEVPGDNKVMDPLV
ncbi:hypothetical protein [Syntrophomonas curvata]